MRVCGLNPKCGLFTYWCRTWQLWELDLLRQQPRPQTGLSWRRQRCCAICRLAVRGDGLSRGNLTHGPIRSTQSTPINIHMSFGNLLKMLNGAVMRAFLATNDNWMILTGAIVTRWAGEVLRCAPSGAGCNSSGHTRRICDAAAYCVCDSRLPSADFQCQL